MVKYIDIGSYFGNYLYSTLKFSCCNRYIGSLLSDCRNFYLNFVVVYRLLHMRSPGMRESDREESMQIVKYTFQQHGDERGMLIALEEYNDIPFEIKRVYYMFDIKEGVQ